MSLWVSLIKSHFKLGLVIFICCHQKTNKCVLLHTRFCSAGWSVGSARVWTVATKPAGTLSVLSCGGLELTGFCVCGTTSNDVRCRTEFVSMLGRYTPSWLILDAIWNREQGIDIIIGEENRQSTSQCLILCYLKFFSAETVECSILVKNDSKYWIKQNQKEKYFTQWINDDGFTIGCCRYTIWGFCGWNEYSLSILQIKISTWFCLYGMSLLSVWYVFTL